MALSTLSLSLSVCGSCRPTDSSSGVTGQNSLSTTYWRGEGVKGRGEEGEERGEGGRGEEGEERGEGMKGRGEEGEEKGVKHIEYIHVGIIAFNKKYMYVCTIHMIRLYRALCTYMY